MRSHWHLVLWPEADRQLARFMQRLTITHVRRWVEYRRRVGLGPVYQDAASRSPWRMTPISLPSWGMSSARALCAGLVKAAEAWRWSSLGQQAEPSTDEIPHLPISRWPIRRRRDWSDWVNEPQTDAELAAIAHSLRHSRPYVSQAWAAATEKRLGLPPLRPRGRPRKMESRERKQEGN